MFEEERGLFSFDRSPCCHGQVEASGKVGKSTTQQALECRSFKSGIIGHFKRPSRRIGFCGSIEEQAEVCRDKQGRRGHRYVLSSS